MVDSSRDSVDEILLSYVTKVLARAKKLNNENLCVPQVRRSLYYKLDRLVLLQVGAEVATK